MREINGNHILKKCGRNDIIDKQIIRSRLVEVSYLK